MHAIQTASREDKLKSVLDKHRKLFKDELGCIQGMKARTKRLNHISAQPELSLMHSGTRCKRSPTGSNVLASLKQSNTLTGQHP